LPNSLLPFLGYKHPIPYKLLQVLGAAGSGHANTVAYGRQLFLLKELVDKTHTFAMACTTLLLT
jgi:hypothetical protein